MPQILHGKVVSPTRLEQGRERAAKRVYPTGRYGATLRNIRIAPNKVRLVIDQIRGESVERAREILRYSAKKAAYLIDRVVLSALGNADVKSQGRVGAEELYVAEAYCNEASRLKRFLAGPMGRARPILRRMAHITVVLGEEGEEDSEVEEAAAPATEAKPAPSAKPEPAAGKAAGAKPKAKAAKPAAKKKSAPSGKTKKKGRK